MPVYARRDEAPEVWDGVTSALRQAGIPYEIVAIRVRWTAMWTCHVDLNQPVGRDPLRPIVGTPDGKRWLVLCLRSDGQNCPASGRWNDAKR